MLVVLLVLLVPELLTGPRSAPPPTPAQPDQAPMRSYTMDLGESAHPRAPVAASTTASPAGEPATPASASAPAPVPAPAQRNAASVTAAAPAGKAAVTQAATEPATQALPPTVGSKSTWTVQLGTFSSRPNAARLVGALKSRGFTAFIAESTVNNGRKLFRVRVGAEKDRAAAQKLLGRLKAAGEKGAEIVSR
jgi:cell division septation protein DedD